MCLIGGRLYVSVGEAFIIMSLKYVNMVQERGAMQTMCLTDKREGRAESTEECAGPDEGRSREASPAKNNGREGNYLLRVAGVCLKAEFKGRMTPTG